MNKFSFNTIILLIFLIIQIACNFLLGNFDSSENEASKNVRIPELSNDTIYVLTHGYFPKKLKDQVKHDLSVFYTIPVRELPPIPLYKDALNPIGRYTAITIMNNLLRDNKGKKGKIVALTEVDITTNMVKRNSPYWGVMGLGFLYDKQQKLTPCVVSTKRMKTNLHDRLAKVSIHEIGHTYGLPHCITTKGCIMSDAEGSGKKIDGLKKELCSNCKKIIRSKNSNQSLVRE